MIITSAQKVKTYAAIPCQLIITAFVILVCLFFISSKCLRVNRISSVLASYLIIYMMVPPLLYMYVLRKDSKSFCHDKFKCWPVINHLETKIQLDGYVFLELPKSTHEAQEQKKLFFFNKHMRGINFEAWSKSHFDFSFDIRLFSS
ncbi:hypothetical protein HanIR_Chr13g0653681 [Helianthus annuus]|nr:hypothetical protein HanIR_Chr13g0653681 [Helianthus annuus]